MSTHTAALPLLVLITEKCKQHEMTFHGKLLWWLWTFRVRSASRCWSLFQTVTFFLTSELHDLSQQCLVFLEKSVLNITWRVTKHLLNQFNYFFAFKSNRCRWLSLVYTFYDCPIKESEYDDVTVCLLDVFNIKLILGIQYSGRYEIYCSIPGAKL